MQKEVYELKKIGQVLMPIICLNCVSPIQPNRSWEKTIKSKTCNDVKWHVNIVTNVWQNGKSPMFVENIHIQ